MFDKDAWAAQQERIERDYADYLVILRQEAKRQSVCGPHCDAYVLHKPGECQSCDHFPVLQEFRVTHSIVFTGDEPKENERPCPATLLRPVEKIHRWHGNRPYSLSLSQENTIEPVYAYKEPLKGEDANDLWLLVRRGLRSQGERYKQWYLQEIARVLELDYSLELGIDWEREFPSQGHY